MSDRIIGIFVLIFGLWGLYTSFTFLSRLKNWYEKSALLVTPITFMLGGFILSCTDRGSIMRMANDKFIFGIIFPVLLILLGILSLRVSQDKNFLVAESEFQYKIFFHLLPKLLEKALKYDHIFAGLSCIAGGLFLIYLFWIKKLS